MTTVRLLRALGASIWIGLRAAILYLVIWPVWAVITVVVWLLSIMTGAWFALMVLLCPGPRLKKRLIDHAQFWFER